jgi:5-formyltetrahydrofolate cyclo-ligase
VRDAGGTVALPRVSDTPPRLRFHASRQVRLRTGRFGISEPPATAPEVRPGELAAMIVRDWRSTPPDGASALAAATTTA